MKVWWPGTPAEPVSRLQLKYAYRLLSVFAFVPAVPVPKTAICSQTLSSNDVEAFTYAITRHYWYELFMDDLPIWGFVGDIRPSKLAGEDDTVVLYTHKQLDISYNGDRVGAMRITSPAAQLMHLMRRWTYS